MSTRFAFITGAASGMGRATARLLAAEGWFIGAVDLNLEGLQSLASELGTNQCFTSTLDVTDRAAYQQVLTRFAERSHGRLDLLYNNAGIGRGGLFEQVPFEEHLNVVQVNLVGVLNGIYSAQPYLANTPNALCFSTSSSSATFGMPGIAVYSATKHAVKGLTEALSVEFARWGVRVACVLPGLIDTPILAGPVFGDMAHTQSDGAIAKKAPTEGLWRLTPAEDVARCVLNAYNDATGKIHWYVPEEIGEIDRIKAESPEQARNMVLGLLNPTGVKV